MKKRTLPKLQEMKGKTPISMVTCYDYSFARLVEKSGIDSILVGDSLGMVIKGEADTLGVTVYEVAYHIKAVRKGAPTPFLIADMPFGSYQSSIAQGIESAIILMKAGAQAVKIEGGKEVADLTLALTNYGIPVISHLGLTPQYHNKFGGFVQQAKKSSEQEALLEAALTLEESGAGMLVLESVPDAVGKMVTEKVNIPVIGIGAGRETDGQVLVLYDILGLNEEFVPPFVKQYATLENTVKDALISYKNDVKKG
ncbi:3-methyl-2-oxobutanoate hydroxymethyltransferase [bacterium]|nr:3-methyl-2-oxobutanoate hydroxymethyltransferase [bacterium]